jgi:rod shape determining protein RodA
MEWTRHLEWAIIGIWIALAAIGLVAIYSATQGPGSEFLPIGIQGNFFKQSIFVAISVVMLAVVQFMQPRIFQSGSYAFYLFCLILTLATIFIGVEINGARSWIRIGGINLQVSELTKFATVMAVSAFLSGQRDILGERIGPALVAVILIIIPAGIIFLQNDTGTALVLIGLIPIMLFWSGIPYGIALLMISPAVIGYFSIIQWYYGLFAAVVFVGLIFFVQRRAWLTITSAALGVAIVSSVQIVLFRILQPHQRARIEVFTNPESDPLGAGWNVLQARTAIGSGGFTGKGFLEGTQTQLRFIPEQWTDFIFTVIGEEFGFIGGALVIILFTVLLLRLLTLAGMHKHPFAQMVTVGVVGIILIHLVINLGSALGLLPVIGIPLPFISYGGSSFLVNTFMLAVCLNMWHHHRELSIYAG